jgi:cysteinyl-tRNA synthetase
MRSFLVSDLLARTFRYLGWEVHNVMNITDVDDKTIARSQERGESLREYTDRYLRLFHEDLATLRIQPAWKYPRATEHIAGMIALIQTLIDKGHAYVRDGSVYFDISSFPHYGKLSGISAAQAGPSTYSRLEADEYERDEVRDFALWKAAKPGEPTWDSPWGPGRPGWSIECSVMAMQYLGTTLDLHLGGVDLIFPHHENEIAQSEGATGIQFVRFWVHVEHLVVEGQKMSKSLGNFFTLRDLVSSAYEPMAIRHQLMTAVYRKQLNFTLDGLRQSTAAVFRLWDFMDRLAEVTAPGAPSRALADDLAQASQKFEASVRDDLNIPEAMAVVFDLMRTVNPLLVRGSLCQQDATAVLDFFAQADKVLGFLSHDKGALDDDVERLIQERDNARVRKDYERADAIRQELLDRGIVLEDTPTGTRWRRAFE